MFTKDCGHHCGIQLGIERHCPCHECHGRPVRVPSCAHVLPPGNLRRNVGVTTCNIH